MAQSWEVQSEWVQQPPDGWEARLRAISPIVDRTSHLRFRYRASVEQWELYECTPAHLLDAGRVAQLTQHWSELPTDQQIGRRRFVTEYQHYMFRTHHVEARRFWVLQGKQGGTPATYTDREQKLLESVGESGDVPELGMFPPCPFDERAVQAILARDNLLKSGYDLDVLAKSQRPSALKAQDDQNEKDYRKAFLGWWYQEMQPMSEFLKYYHRQTEAQYTLRPGTPEISNAVSKWAEFFVETGQVIGAETPSSKTVQMTVA